MLAHTGTYTPTRREPETRNGDVMAEEDPDQESTANSTLSRMLAGNRRFAEGHSEHPWQDMQTRESLIDRQNPDAAVLSCSDSRVPPEIIFDAGLGDLFTIRTAGRSSTTRYWHRWNMPWIICTSACSWSWVMKAAGRWRWAPNNLTR